MWVRKKRISSWLIVLLLALAGPAVAATVTEIPVISGDPGLYSELSATPGAWTPAGADPSYAWLRCGADGENCTPIDGACSLTYKTDDPDLGNTLRIRLTVVESGGPTATEQSAPTLVIERKPYSIPTGEVPPDTCTKVTPTGPNTGSFDSGTEPQPQPGPIPVPGEGLTDFIRPFPVIRIAGRFTRRYTKVTRVSVRAPRGVRIGVACRGRGCAYRRRALAARVRRVSSLQRRYRPGAVLEIRVTQPERIGKYVRVRIRSGRAPRRIDRCLLPTKKRPVRCPAA
jgi:hypothetical protein